MKRVGSTGVRLPLVGQAHVLERVWPELKGNFNQNLQNATEGQRSVLLRTKITIWQRRTGMWGWIEHRFTNTGQKDIVYCVSILHLSSFGACALTVTSDSCSWLKKKNHTLLLFWFKQALISYRTLSCCGPGWDPQSVFLSQNQIPDGKLSLGVWDIYTTQFVFSKLYKVWNTKLHSKKKNK